MKSSANPQQNPFVIRPFSGDRTKSECLQLSLHLLSQPFDVFVLHEGGKDFGGNRQEVCGWILMQMPSDNASVLEAMITETHDMGALLLLYVVEKHAANNERMRNLIIASESRKRFGLNFLNSSTVSCAFEVGFVKVLAAYWGVTDELQVIYPK